jgi:malonyl-CoA/methylmalonyl-CoA synthetase
VQQESVRAWQEHLGAPFEAEQLSARETLTKVWNRQWESHPDRTVLVAGEDPTEIMTGRSLQERSRAAATAIERMGVRGHGRVVWSCTPTLESVVWLLGALRLGAVVVPVSPSLSSSELAYVVGDVHPTVAIVEREEHRDLIAEVDTGVAVATLEELRRRPIPTMHLFLDQAGPDDDALIVYTSGTTGKPKGAVHTHGSLLAGVESLRLAWDWQDDDRLILALPLFHVHGLCAGLFATLASGSSAVVFNRFDVDAVLGEVERSTMLFGVPTMYHRLAETGRAGELALLRLCVSGSAPLPPALWRRLENECGVAILERYGMSETMLTLSNPLRGERRPGTVGLPLPGVEARLTNRNEHGIGELQVRGPMLCRAYWERPEATAAQWDQEWFSTGDLASVDDDGYYAIRGRLTEMIITGGHNVYPSEVEAVLVRHPSVREIAVVGVESAEWGETVTAFVVGADGEPDIAGISRLAAEELSPYKQPRQYRVVNALPRNAMGKIIRRDLQ